jgi:cytochrome c nitrite reductase small subunit
LTDNLAISNLSQLISHRTERQCLECHRETPHGRVNSLASVPHARMPKHESIVPGWLNELMKNTKK